MFQVVRAPRNLKGTPISMNAIIHPKNIQLHYRMKVKRIHTHSNPQGSQLYTIRITYLKKGKHHKVLNMTKLGFFVCSTGTQVYRLHPPPFARQRSVPDLLRFCDMLF